MNVMGYRSVVLTLFYAIVIYLYFEDIYDIIMKCSESKCLAKVQDRCT